MKKFISPRVRKKSATKISNEAIPRITNDSVSKHREEVIAGAKKYVYPLRHSRHRVVLVSVSMLVLLFIGLSTFILLSFYKFNSTSSFAYQVSKMVPLPIAKVGGAFVPYEEYLFELKHFIYYLENQQDVDVQSEQGKRQIDYQSKKSLETVIDNDYAKKIAKEHGITVTNEEVEQYIELLKKQNRLGSDGSVFEDVIKEYYNWTIDDFKRKIKQDILNYKVIKKLDPEVQKKAETAMDELSKGSSFADVAKKYSEDDTTKDNGGKIDFLIAKNDQNVDVEVMNALEQLQPGQVSKIIDLGHSLVIVRLDAIQDDQYSVSRMVFKYKELKDYLNDKKVEQPATYYIKLPEPEPESTTPPATESQPVPATPAQ